MTCKHCGNPFEPTKHEKELLDEGFITIDDISLCSDCFEVENETPIENQQYRFLDYE